MDYRALLIKYIAHVTNEEGSDFIGHVSTEADEFKVLFTADERAALETLAEEAEPLLGPIHAAIWGDGRG